jgi:predicted transcriptional regulator
MELPTPDDIRERRDEELGLTQADLAERADVSQPLIARIEGGDVDPRLSTLRRIVEALNEAEGGILRASDLMNDEVVSVAPDDSVHETRQRMEEKGYSQVPVLQDGSPDGFISMADIVAAAEERDVPVGQLPVSEVKHDSFVTVEPDASIDAIEGYLTHNDAVLVVEAGQTIGIITEADLARHLS